MEHLRGKRYIIHVYSSRARELVGACRSLLGRVSGCGQLTLRGWAGMLFLRVKEVATSDNLYYAKFILYTLR